jgi:hypothetical protein
MGTIKNHYPVKYICAVTFNLNHDTNQILSLLSEEFGETDLHSPVFDFDVFTDYYEPEMGSGLRKFFIAFKNLQDPGLLPAYKIKSNRLEKQFRFSGKRQVNLDPGYVTEAKVVLATTKDYSHRIYLDQGIFADLHLFFDKGSFRAQPWTYPDYKQDLSIHFFNRLRECLRSQLIHVKVDFSSG